MSKIDTLANNDAYSLSVCVRKNTGDTLILIFYNSTSHVAESFDF